MGFGKTFKKATKPVRKIGKKAKKAGKKAEKRVVRPAIKPVKKTVRSLEKRGIMVEGSAGSDGINGALDNGGVRVEMGDNGNRVIVHN